jgi:RNase P subunit RPR2
MTLITITPRLFNKMGGKIRCEFCGKPLRVGEKVEVRFIKPKGCRRRSKVAYYCQDCSKVS